jgi:transposase
VVLSDVEREQLEAWSRRRSSAQALALRSRIVLAAAEGLKNTEIAERLGVHRQVAAKWRSRFAAERLDGLVDEPRPGRPRTVTDAQVDEVITNLSASNPLAAVRADRAAGSDGRRDRPLVRGGAAGRAGAGAAGRPAAAPGAEA